MPTLPKPQWTPELDALLGQDSDKTIAKTLGTEPRHVSKRRAELRIAAFVPPRKAVERHAWTLAQDLALYENLLTPSSTLSEMLGLPVPNIEERRVELGLRRADSSNRATLRKGARYFQMYLRGTSPANIATKVGETANVVQNAVEFTFVYLRRHARYARMRDEMIQQRSYAGSHARAADWLLLCAKAIDTLQAEDDRIAAAHRQLIEQVSR